MEFRFEPEKITKQLLLENKSEEEFFNMYLNLPVVKGKSYKNPLRSSDKKPGNCNFFRTQSGLYFRDFAINKNYSFIDVVMCKYNLNYQEALDFIAKDIGLLKNDNSKIVEFKKFENSKIKENKKSKIQVTIQPFKKSELEWWESFGIDISILEKFRVYSIKAVFLNDRLLCLSSDKNPIYGYFFGRKEGLEIWKIYFPFKKDKYRFLSNCDSTIIQGLKLLNTKEDYLFITKSLKDVMLGFSFNISMIAPNSETFTFNDEDFSKLKNNFKHIYLLFDNDYAGVLNANKWKKKYPEIIVLFIKRKYGKDLTDVYKDNKDLKEEIFIELKNIIKNKINKPKYFYIFN